MYNENGRLTIYHSSIKGNLMTIETPNILATQGKTEYWTVDAACMHTRLDSLQLRAALRDADLFMDGVSVFWDEDTNQTGEFDFGIHVCDMCFQSCKPKQAKPVCTCE